MLLPYFTATSQYKIWNQYGMFLICRNRMVPVPSAFIPVHNAIHENRHVNQLMREHVK